MERKGTLDQTVTPWEPSGGGEMGDLIQRYDWTATPLGPMVTWPHAIRVGIDLMLTMRQPACIWWGEEPRLLYNDDYRPILGSKHPAALGRTMSEAWPELVGSHDHPLNVVRAHGPQFLPDREFVLGAEGERRSRWFTSTWTPLHDETGTVIGVFNVSTETTQRVLAEPSLRESEARQAFVLTFSDALRAQPSPDAVADRAIRMLIEHLQLDRSYIVSYRVDEDRADLVHQVGNDSVPPLPDVFILSDYPDAFRATLDQTLVIEDDYERQDLSEAEQRNSRGLGMRAMVAATLRKGANSPLCSMVAISAHPRRWTRGEVMLVEEVAERTWAAIERAKAELALRVSEERYQTLFEASPVPFMVLAPNPPDFTILAANTAYYEATLRTPETLLGRRLFDVFSDDPSRPGLLGSEALAISLDKVLNERRTDVMKRVRYDIVNPQGEFEPHWWEAINAPMLDASGTVSAIIHQVHRVTELERAEQTEKEAQDRQEFLLKLSDALRPLADPGAVQAAATALLRDRLDVGWCYYVEFDEAALSSVVLRDAVRDRLPSMVGVHDVSDVPEFLDFLRLGQMFNVSDFAHYEGVSPDVRERYTTIGVRSMLGTPIIKEGHLVAWFQVCDTRRRDWLAEEARLVQEVADRTWDALQRARAEAALVASEERYRTLFETMGQGYCDLELVRDADGRAVDQRYLEFNPAFERIFGIPVTRARGRRATEVFPGLEPWWTETFDRVARAGTAERIEHDLGSLGRWFEVWVYPRGGDRVTVLYDEVTERARAEAALRASEEKFRSLVESMQEAVAIADLERDAEGRPIGYRILDANPAFGQEMGVPLDRAVGRLRSEWTQVPNPLLLQNQASWRA